jgi:hypothetical protein
MPTEHKPAPPVDPEPPPELKGLSQRLRHPDVASVGLTTTPKGEWALMVRLKGEGPIPEIERKARGYPVVYVKAGPTPVARPAYPAQGE